MEVGSSKHARLSINILVWLPYLLGGRPSVFQERDNSSVLLLRFRIMKQLSYTSAMVSSQNSPQNICSAINYFSKRRLVSEFSDSIESTSPFSDDPVRSSQQAFQPCRRGPQKSFSIQSPVIQMGSLISRPSCF